MAPKKGKKSGKKGKKGKKEKKEETMEKKASANEKIWQARLRTMEITKNGFRENAQDLASHNDRLQGQMRQVELDTIDVITFLKAQDQKKDTAVEKLEGELKKCLQQQEQEKATLMTDYTEQIRVLEEQITKKQDDIVLMQNELKHVKEFKKKRVAMQRELDEIKDTMFVADKEHKEEVSRITDKFEDEKVAMQQDTNHKISVLADIAHQQAITNLDENTRSIYKENVRLTEALRFHKLETDRLKKENHEFEESNEKLRSEQDDKELSVQERVSEAQRQNLKIQEAEEKSLALETTLNDMVEGFNREQRNIKRYSKIESQSSQVELTKLERLLQMKSVESSRVKKLARNILLQRTDVELCFLEALQQVKEDVAITRGIPAKDVTISDIPWELREVILRRLFTKMNASAPPPKRVTAAPQNDYALTEEQLQQLHLEQPILNEDDMTFLTQGGQLNFEIETDLNEAIPP